ncbi:MAG: DUF1684 domain-containing protein [Acidobacteria bacterium]|nr:MAG: DUF1684 domain-containing protein [Acidobacteriota bacterium]
MRRLLLVLLVLLPACSPGPPDESKYIERVERARAAKNEFLRSSPDSPVPAGERDRFLPLTYYPPDSGYAVPAAFVPDPPGARPKMELQTSAKKRRLMERLGLLRFTLQGKPFELAAFVESGQPPDRLFVPFADTTSGSETYPGGRYLDIPPETTGIYVVDFNGAYNPYCYYNPAYDCPFPPRENRLSISINAGEKVR